MSYVIAYQKPHQDYFQVEINPEIVAFLIGEPIDRVAEVVESFCQPDPKSRTTVEEGRKLIKIGSFDYRVVNGKKYHDIKKEAERREQNNPREILVSR